MKYGILPKLSKDFILNEVSQEEIFAHYLNISLMDVITCVNTGSFICSPLRVDKRPSMGFRYNGNRLRAKDFSGHFWGDCYDLVGYLLNINPNSKNGFGIILDSIAKDFKIHRYANADKVIKNSIKISKLKVNKEPKSRAIIEYTERNWNKIDVKFWRPLHLGSRELNFFDIKPARTIYVNGILRYEYDPYNPAYVYDFGLNDIKVYYPFRKTRRFITNTTITQGMSKITCGKVVLITKSYKDVASIRATINVQAVAPQSETQLISEEDYNILKQNFDYIFSLMDYDRTGKLMAKKLRDMYGVIPLFVNQKANGIKLNHGKKDYTDLLKHKKIDYIKALVDNTKDYYNNIINNFKEKNIDYDKFY